MNAMPCPTTAERAGFPIGARAQPRAAPAVTRPTSVKIEARDDTVPPADSVRRADPAR